MARMDPLYSWLFIPTFYVFCYIIMSNDCLRLKLTSYLVFKYKTRKAMCLGSIWVWLLVQSVSTIHVLPPLPSLLLGFSYGLYLGSDLYTRWYIFIYWTNKVLFIILLTVEYSFMCERLSESATRSLLHYVANPQRDCRGRFRDSLKIWPGSHGNHG